MTANIKNWSDSNLDKWEETADRNDWEHIRHMIRNEKQVRMK